MRFPSGHVVFLAVLGACSGEGSPPRGGADAAADGPGVDGTVGDASPPDGAVDLGPEVDRTDPQLHTFSFTAVSLDAAATVAPGNERAFLDTRVDPEGLLVVFLHGAESIGAGANCASGDHATMLAGLGFHVLTPCYLSTYGVANCGTDIGGCRLEAFEGVDHHDVISVGRADSIEGRVVKALEHLDATHPGGDWGYFLAGDVPRWERIVISGMSHGASTSGLIGLVRSVERVVMLSGPFDMGQAWQSLASATPKARFFGFSHTDDDQHAGHLAAFEALGLPGVATSVDGALAPYGESHRLISAAVTGNGHTATQAGGSSPKTGGGAYAYAPVWRLMYGDR